MKKEKGGDTLFKKKQVLAVLSIVVASCLVGTMFDVNFAIKGKDEDNGDGSPWDRVWTAISELESRARATFTVVNMKYVATDKSDHIVKVPNNKTWIVVAIRIFCLRTWGQESLIELTLMDETGQQFWCGWGQVLTGSVDGILAQSMFAYSGAGTSIVGLQHGNDVNNGDFSYLGCTDYASLPDPCYLEANASIRMRDRKGNAQYVKYWLRVHQSDA